MNRWFANPGNLILAVAAAGLLAAAGCGGGGSGKTTPDAHLSAGRSFSTLDSALLMQTLYDLGYTQVAAADGGIQRTYPKGIAIQRRAGASDLLWAANTYTFQIMHPVNKSLDRFSLFAVIDLETERVMRYIRVQNQPVAVAFDAAHEYAYVIHNEGYLTKINASTFEIVKEERVGSILVDIIVHGDTAFVSDRRISNQGRVYIFEGIDAITGPEDSFAAIRTTVTMPRVVPQGISDRSSWTPSSPAPVGLALDPDNGRLFIACYEANRVLQYYLDTGTFAMAENALVSGGNWTRKKQTATAGHEYYEYWVVDRLMPISRIREITIGGDAVCDPEVDNGRLELDPQDNGNTVIYYCKFDNETGVLTFYHDSNHNNEVRGDTMIHKNAYVDTGNLTARVDHYRSRRFGADEFPLAMEYDAARSLLYTVVQKRSGGKSAAGFMRVFDFSGGADIEAARALYSQAVDKEPMRVAFSPSSPWVVVTHRLPLTPRGHIMLIEETGYDERGRFQSQVSATVEGGHQPWGVVIADDGYTAYVSNIESQDIVIVNLGP